MSKYECHVLVFLPLVVKIEVPCSKCFFIYHGTINICCSRCLFMISMLRIHRFSALLQSHDNNEVW